MLISTSTTKSAVKLSSVSHLVANKLKAIVFIYCFAVSNLVEMVLGNSIDYCYSDIGCFPLSAEFYHPQHRPFNVRPWHRRHIKTQFELFNRQHPEGYMLVPWNKFNLQKSGFNPRLETKIIIPGWLDNINRALWVRQLKDALLWLWTPVNIIVVSWRNFTPYTIATANTRVVGAELANVLKFIEAEMNYDRAYYHIIGHSLGAHIAGYCGDRIYGLGRITALDPARPFFQGMPKSVRLDRGDAKFVDAIHSDFTPENAIFLLMSYGMTTPVGHLDFYPNGPPLFQPGCLRDTLTSVQDGIVKGLQHNSLSIAFLETIRYLTACDHQRSHEWFIESITNRACAFVGVRCNEFEGMINGRCTCDDSPSACAIMGIHADQMYMNNVHEELWPVRAGSIDFKYIKSPSRPPPPRPTLRPLPPLESQFQPLTTDNLPLSHEAQMLMAASLNRIPFQTQIDHPLATASHSEQAANLLMPLHEVLQAGLFPIPAQAIAQSPSYYQGPNPASVDPALFPAAYLPNMNILPTREDIYAHLKHQARKLQQQQEPSILDYDPSPHESSESSTVSYHDEAPPPIDAEHLDTQASEQFIKQQVAALDDMFFVQFLKINLLTDKLSSLSDKANNETANPIKSSARRRNDDSNLDQEKSSRTQTAPISRRNSTSAFGHPDQYDGHPLLLSNLNRDIESWYEDNSKWFLKTNNRPKYCSNQYQLLIFLGPLKTSNGRDSLRANLIVSIIGSRGQLLNQRFVPRGSTLNSFTMQPFFILLEGSYSLGQIKSVAIAWEARNDPDPVQATIKFQSSLLENVGSKIPAYRTRNNPWMPHTIKQDVSEALAGDSRTAQAFSHSNEVAAPSNIAAVASILRSNIGGHYGNKYDRLNMGSGESIKRIGRSSEKIIEANEKKSNSGTEIRGQATLKSSKFKRDIVQRMDSDYTSAGLENLNQDVDLEPTDSKETDYNQPEPAETDIEAAATAIISSNPRSLLTVPLNDPLVQAPSTGESIFVPLVDLPEPASRVRPPGAPADIDSEGEFTLDLHNIDLHHDGYVENSIVINKVIVSPVQAYYGQHGRNAKSFCPPNSKRKLRQDKTVRLLPAIMGYCS